MSQKFHVSFIQTLPHSLYKWYKNNIKCISILSTPSLLVQNYRLLQSPILIDFDPKDFQLRMRLNIII
jgi:hypothetical protein